MNKAIKNTIEDLSTQQSLRTVADNPLLRVVFRFLMVVALAIMTFFGDRLVTQFDTITSTVNTLINKTAVLVETVDNIDMRMNRFENNVHTRMTNIETDVRENRNLIISR